MDGFAAWKRLGILIFLTGKNNRKWRADFDFIVTSKFTKIMEGAYDNTKKTANQQIEEIFKNGW